MVRVVKRITRSHASQGTTGLSSRTSTGTVATRQGFICHELGIHVLLQSDIGFRIFVCGFEAHCLDEAFFAKNGFLDISDFDLIAWGYEWEVVPDKSSPASGIGNIDVTMNDEALFGIMNGFVARVAEIELAGSHPLLIGVSQVRLDWLYGFLGSIRKNLFDQGFKFLERWGRRFVVSGILCRLY